MQVDVALIIAVVGCLVGLSGWYFSRKKDTHEFASQATTVIVELQTVRRDISEMKADVAAMRQEWREDHDKLVGMERDIKAIWKQVDKINGKDSVE